MVAKSLFVAFGKRKKLLKNLECSKEFCKRRLIELERSRFIILFFLTLSFCSMSIYKNYPILVFNFQALENKYLPIFETK